MQYEAIVGYLQTTSYRIAGGAKYTILDDNVGYIYYESFSSNPIGNGNLNEYCNTWPSATVSSLMFAIMEEGI
ncbi:MAG: hypothetical protein R2738_01105 [Bacteroides graminisolvens]